MEFKKLAGGGVCFRTRAMQEYVADGKDAEDRC